MFQENVNIHPINTHRNIEINILKPTPDFLNDFIKWIVQSGNSSTSQARILSGIRSFYDYLLLEKQIDKNPAG